MKNIGFRFFPKPFIWPQLVEIVLVSVTLICVVVFASHAIVSWRKAISEKGVISAPRVETSVIKTGLLSLTKTVIIPDQDLDMMSGTGSSIAIVGDRVLIADRYGRFYAADIKGRSASIRRLDIDITTNFQKMLDVSEQVMGVKKYRDESYFLVGVMDVLVGADGRRLVASYSHWDIDKSCVTMRLAVAELSQDWSTLVDDWRVFFETTPCLEPRPKYFGGLQAGGRLVEIRPGVVLMTIGDFAFDGFNSEVQVSQDVTVGYGKIFEIDLATGDNKVVSIGHRNPQGLALDRNGNVWSTEHGPQGGDELNLIEQGANYGWPTVTYGTQYGTFAWPLAKRQGRHDGFALPAYAWMPSIGISNLIEINGFAPEWDGDLLVSSLNDRTLYRLRIDGHRVIYAEPIKTGYRMRDLGQLSDGRILIWIDWRRLVILEPERFSQTASDTIATLDQDVQDTLARCEECHQLDPPGDNDSKISLWGVLGRRLDFGNPGLKSDSLRNAGGTWNRGRLDAFLADPDKTVPGTAMPDFGLKDGELRKKLIRALEKMAPGNTD